MPQLLSIVGPTATGKTNTSLALAKKIIDEKLVDGVDLISADSRQVYQGLEVLTGADVPSGFSRKNNSTDNNTNDAYFTNHDDSIKIYGVAIILPTDEWSVAHFQTMAQAIIANSWATHRLPIIVGGTGLYLDQLLVKDQRLHVGPNSEVRQKAETMTVAQLQHWFNKLDNSRFEKMNHSDQNNPRRLVRAIEINLAQAKQSIDETSSADHLTVGLTAPLALIEEKIGQRVIARFDSGALDEVKNLSHPTINPTLPVASTLGISELTQYLAGEINVSDCQKLWSLHEFQYAKRQLTWWKHRSTLNWFDVNQPHWQEELNQQVLDWLGSGVEAI